MDKALLRAVNVAVLVACIAIVFQVGRSALREQALAKPDEPISGTTIKDVGGLKFASARSTLILVTHSKCHYCQASLPFYKQLTAAAHAAGVRVVGVSSEDIKVHRDFLEAGGLFLDDVISMKAANIRATGTPTLILVNRQGVIQESWIGQLPADKERHTISAVVGARG
jgi:peroxiredoxin